MGYGGNQDDVKNALTPRSHDEGIDGVIKQDHLGLEKIYLQAKRWKSGTVGSAAVREFAGSVDNKKANKGVFITTSSFTSDALACTFNNATIILIDGKKLCELMWECDLGLNTSNSYPLKKIDSDFFSEDP